MGHDAAEHDQPGDHQRVAASALGADEARETDGPGGAGNVLDRCQTGETLALQRLLHHPRGLIPAASGCSWCDEAQLFDGLRVGGRHRKGERRQGEGGAAAKRHRPATVPGKPALRPSSTRD